MGIEHGLREELLLSPRIGFENNPSRKAFGVLRLILSDSHSSTFSDLILKSMASVKIMLRCKKKERDKKNKKAAFTMAWMKLLLNFQAQKTTQERIIVERFSSSAPNF